MKVSPPEQFQHLRQRRPHRPQLLQMHPGQALQSPLSFHGQLDQHAPSIGGIDTAADDPELRHPVHELDRGVMTNQKITG